MDMGMVHHGGCPGVEYGHGTGPCTKKTRIPAKGIKGRPCRLEDQVVADCLIDVKQFVQALGNGEHHMKVFAGQEFTLQMVNPLCLPHELTFVAVPVAA